MIKLLTIEQVEFGAHKLAQELLSFNEPIPDFDTRYPNILESCLLTPFGSFGGKDLYAGLENKAAILFYLMVKNHPFQNGNKRIAVMSLLLFLHQNNRWLYVDNREFYNFAVWVASSPAELKDQTVDAVIAFIKKHQGSLKPKK